MSVKLLDPHLTTATPGTVPGGETSVVVGVVVVGAVVLEVKQLAGRFGLFDQHGGDDRADLIPIARPIPANATRNRSRVGP
jgi:hypothetical protein